MIDFKTCKVWENNNYELIGSKERFDRLFKTYQVDGFATFQKNNKSGWVNKHGNQIGTLHDGVATFQDNYSLFFDRINDVVKWGYINHLGLEIMVSDLELYIKIEKKLLKVFTEGSLKEYMWRCFYDKL